MAFKMRGNPMKRNFGIGALSGAPKAASKAAGTPMMKTYAEAKKKDPKLDSYIKERKQYDPGSEKYEAVQAKINKAYGKVRDTKMKAGQVKKVKARKVAEKATQEEANKKLIADIEKKAKKQVATSTARRNYVVKGGADKDRKAYKKSEMAKIKAAKKSVKETAKGMTRAE